MLRKDVRERADALINSMDGPQVTEHQRQDWNVAHDHLVIQREAVLRALEDLLALGARIKREFRMQSKRR